MSNAGQNIYKTKRWKELRASVLAEEPICHWCRTAPSTEADHLVELARGGEPYERSNLVGSCKPCNSRRGSAFQAKTQQARRQKLGDGYSVIIRNCEHCNIEFRPDWRNVKRGQGKYCSRECAAEAKSTYFGTYTATWNCRVCGEACSTGPIKMRENFEPKPRRTCGAEECSIYYNRELQNMKYREETTCESLRTIMENWPGLLPETWQVEITRREEVFFYTEESTPPPHLPVSRKNESDSAESSATPIDGASSGPRPPRLITASWGDKSFGPQVAAWAKANMQIDMFPWQIDAINGMLEVDDNNRLRHRFALVSVGRQNGKTKGLLAPLIGWWLTYYAAQKGEPQNVMSTAHKLDVAEDVGNVLFPILEEQFGFETYRSFGRKEAFHAGGSRWRIVSSGESAGHGTSNDLVVVDEIWNVKPEVIEGGLLPTQTARPAPFAFFTSTAGSEESKFFIRWRERGMQQIETGQPGRLYMAEWSPPPNVDPTERRWWSWANPALGYTITEQELEDKLEALERGEFVRHHCNLWTSSIGSWLPHGAWEGLEVDDPMPAGGILAVDSNATDMRYVGVRVAQREDGRYQADTAFTVESQDEMWEQIHAVMKDRSVQLALTPGLAAICPLDLSRRMTIWGYQEINRYTAIVKGMILEGRMAHNGGMTLTEQVNRAVAGRTGTSITLTSQKSPGPIEQCRCMVAAAGMAAKPASNVRKPMIGMSR